MLAKLFGVRKIERPLPTPPPAAAEDGTRSPPLRIVHAGGYVECYYMAVPAVGIMVKHPRSVLARPDVFQRPWDSLVRPDEVLTPGETFYFVPRRTMRKLQQRARGPAHDPSGDLGSMRSTFQKRPARRRLRVGSMWEPSLMVIDEALPLTAPAPPPSKTLSQ